jgi:trehalose 6-phosphate synthase
MLRCRAFPIGIDVEGFTALAQARASQDMYERMRHEYARRRLLLGVDRLDYSKGLPQRMRAFRELLARHPDNRRSATLIQIGSPTREGMATYADIRRELESLCGAINGDYGELDWMPVRYIHQTLARECLPGLCRAAAVGLVTPLRDGMNLVAKEYVAAQDPSDPGVLVLSRFAGAAEQLREALLVNPYDVQGTAATVQQALHMPLDERRARHQRLLQRIREQDVHWWRRSFLDALKEAAPAEQRSRDKDFGIPLPFVEKGSASRRLAMAPQRKALPASDVQGSAVSDR